MPIVIDQDASEFHAYKLPPGMELPAANFISSPISLVTASYDGKAYLARVDETHADGPEPFVAASLRVVGEPGTTKSLRFFNRPASGTLPLFADDHPAFQPRDQRPFSLFFLADVSDHKSIVTAISDYIRDGSGETFHYGHAIFYAHDVGLNRVDFT